MPCYTFVDNRRDGLGASTGAWWCRAAGLDWHGLNLSPDRRTWELEGHQTGPARGRPAVARIVRVVGGRRYPARLLANGYFIGVAPATGNVTLEKLAASGRTLVREVSVRRAS
jgi:hypothetical protein